ncbi:histone-fold-containing protein, partial [Dioszegia hungarica]
LVEPHQELNDFLESFWTRQMDFVERDNPDFRTYPLPLARIKKVMKSDEEVKMISAEAPILFSKACELFISELTCRAWLIAESNKRRTLQKSDVAAAIALSDMFDFLIDILPRDDD